MNKITEQNISQSLQKIKVYMGELFEITGMKNVPNDNIVKRPANARIAKSTLDNKIQDKIMTPH